MTDPRPDADAPPQPHPLAVDGRVGQWVRPLVLLVALVLLTRAAGMWGLVMVLGLVLMIFLHELGHFIMAKRAGMKVTEFFLGFGPKLWSFRRGETEYGLKLIPAGAYVRIIGMNSLEEVDAADEERTYRAKPFWQRFGVAVAGSSMHFLQAFAIVFVLLAFIGVSGGTLALPSKQAVRWPVEVVYDHCPSQKADLRPGDEIVSIDGHDTTDWTHTADVLAGLPGHTVTMQVRRNGTLLTKHLTLGTRVVDGKAIGMIGVQVGIKAPKAERVGVASAVPQTFRELGEMGSKSVSGFARFFTPSHLSSYGRQVADAQKQADKGGNAPTTTTPTSKPPPKPGVDDKACAAALASGSGTGTGGPSTLDQESRISSIFGIFQIGSQVGQKDGVGALLAVFAFINIFIGLFNLFPMLPFDGGHVVIAVYEKAQEWRLRQRTRYLADVTRLLPLTYGLILVMGMIFVSSLYLDIVNPVSLK